MVLPARSMTLPCPALREGQAAEAVRLFGAADVRAGGRRPAREAHHARVEPSSLRPGRPWARLPSPPPGWRTGAAAGEAARQAVALPGALVAPPSKLAEKEPADATGLAGREGEVLRLLSQGLTDSEIADALCISPRTVGGHVTNLLAKLGVASRAAAAAYATRHGLA